MPINTPDHAGPQPVLDGDSNAPEVVHGSRTPFLEHTSGVTTSPEVWNKAAYYDKNVEGYYPVEKSQAEAYVVTPPNGHAERQAPGRTFLGLKRRTFFIVLGVVIAVIVIVAAVVGGVVASRSSKNSTSAPSASPSASSSTASPSSAISSSSSASSQSASPPSMIPIATQKKSGLALSIPADTNTNTPNIISYYIHTNGSIMELRKNSTPSSGNMHRVVVQSGAVSGSPLAAVSWVSQFITFRQIFYIDNNGRVMTTNISDSSANAAWTTPYNILTNDVAAQGTPALAACVGTSTPNKGLDGMRIYYGSEKGYIQEVGFNFFDSSTSPVWNMWMKFPDSDANSGVGCAIQSDYVMNHLYMRNTTTGDVQQWLWNYSDPVAWTMGASGLSNMTTGGNLAVAYDGSSTDYIFYEAQGSRLQGAMFTSGDSINGLDAVNSLVEHSKISTAYDANSGGSLVAYQAQDARAASVTLDAVNRGGGISSKGLLSLP